MKKQLWLSGVFVCSILLCVFVVSKMQHTPSEEDEVKQVDVAGESEASYKMSDYSVLDAQDLKDVTIEKGYLRPVAEMLKNMPGYGEMHDELLAFLGTISEDQSMGCYGEKKFFASTMPIYYWNPKKGQVGTAQIDVIVFSHDFNNAFCYSMLYENDQCISQSIEEFDNSILKILKNNGNKKFVFLYDVLKEEVATPILLCEDNMIYGTAISGDYTVKGDYFSCIKEIAFSYKDMIDARNLVEINIE
ncbi:MAG: hypothetical protein J1E62_05790 [Lachnospiraceae bacterium]|nr:hypothetical protein [Lachnospiraceae bacterium]